MHGPDRYLVTVRSELLADFYWGEPSLLSSQEREESHQPLIEQFHVKKRIKTVLL